MPTGGRSIIDPGLNCFKNVPLAAREVFSTEALCWLNPA